MSEYKGIKGFSIQSLSADPADPNIGQVWYNSTSDHLWEEQEFKLLL
jgi:hypothetical protein